MRTTYRQFGLATAPSLARTSSTPPDRMAGSLLLAANAYDDIYVIKQKEAGMSEGMKKEDLYPLQEAVLVRLQNMNDPQLSGAKLCGGTALARCWLDHRVSYDLDFFLPDGFGAAKLAVALKKAGIDYETKDIVDSSDKANQLHGYVLLGGKRLRVSFVKDAYFDLFPIIEVPFGNASVNTEPVEGLYHRKLRTVSGHAAQGDSVEGGRQTARDVFDLFVLSRMVMPIRPFIESLPYAFPSPAFDNGLANMPWFELMDELKELVCDPEWNAAKDVYFLQNALYEQIGAALVTDEAETEPEPVPPGTDSRGRSKPKGRAS